MVTAGPPERGSGRAEPGGTERQRHCPVEQAVSGWDCSSLRRGPPAARMWVSRVQDQEEVGLEETFHSPSLGPKSSTFYTSGHQVLTQQGKPSQAVGVANVFKNWKLGQLCGE